MAARVAPQGLPPLAHDEGADLGERPLPADRLPGRSSTTRRPKAEERAEEPRRGRSRSCSRPTRSSASRCASAERSPGVAVDAVFDSVSVATTFKEQAARSSASSSAPSPRRCRSIPELVQKYLGSVVPYTDNFFATLNSAVFTDGSFCYVPKGVRCPMELSTYFRINAAEHRPVRAHADHRRRRRVRQLPRRLHGADARREPAARRGRRAGRARRRARSSTRPCRTGTRATRTARAASTTSSPSAASAAGRQLEDLLDAGRDRLGDHLEVPELHPAGRRLGRRVLLGRADQQLPAGRHRHEDDPHRQEHESTIVSKGISAGHGQNTLPRPGEDPRQGATSARNYSQCDSLLIGDQCGAHTFPYIEVQQLDGAGRARGLDLEDRRGPDLLLPAARHLGRGRRQHDRQRLLQGGLQGAADGVRRRGAEAARRVSLEGSGRDEPNAHARDQEPARRRVDGNEILEGRRPHRRRRARCTRSWGPNGSGKSTLAHVLAGRPGYEVTAGQVLYEGRDLLAMTPEERAREGVFLAFQYPVEIPGVGNVYFLKPALNAIRKHRGAAGARRRWTSSRW